MPLATLGVAVLGWTIGAAVAAPKPPGLRIEGARPTSYALTLDLDPDKDSFAGHAEIDVALPGRTALLWLHANGLDVLTATVTGPDGVVRDARVLPGDDQTIGLKFKPLDGTVRVAIGYTGGVQDVDTIGVFRQEEGGDRYLFTQFEATDARRAFPCFDQPDAKVPWSLTLRVPTDLVALSNTHAVEQDVVGDTRIVRFATTQPLPSYLVAFAVGPFDLVDAGTAGRASTPIRLAVPRGRGPDAAWSAAATPPLLAWQEDWVDRAYAFGKLDVVALPVAVGFGAMEHPGLITIVSDITVTAPEDDTITRRRDYVETMIHELAHQWFGNEVTPAWWDDLWLNESFATWMEGKAVAGLYPEWQPEIGRIAAREGVMSQDGLSTVRRIREPIASLDDIENAFDGITYGKGQQVLTMFEAWVGPDAFQAGIRAYIDAHAGGNATTADFVAAIGTAAGREVNPVFAGFLDQPGVPLVSATLTCEPTVSLTLTQQRYAVGVAPGKERWAIPVCARYPGVSAPQRACTLLDQPTVTLPLAGADGCPDAVLLNDGMSGYYRSAVTEADLSALLDHGGLTVGETVGLIGDAAAQVQRGALAPGAVLGALPQLLALDEPKVTEATLGVAEALDAHLVPPDLRPAYQRFLRDTYGLRARELGFDPIEDEADDDMLLRRDLLIAVGVLGEEPELAQEARRRTDQWLADGTGIHVDVLEEVLTVAAHHGDVALYEALRARATSEEDRGRRGVLIGALGSFTQPEIATRNIEWVISGELDIREAGPLFFGAFASEALRPLAWDLTREHIVELEKLIPAVARAYLIWSGAGFCDAERRAEVESFFAPRARRWLGGKRTLSNVLERVDQCIATRASQQDAVRAFLEGWTPPEP